MGMISGSYMMFSTFNCWSQTGSVEMVQDGEGGLSEGGGSMSDVKDCSAVGTKQWLRSEATTEVAWR